MKRLDWTLIRPPRPTAKTRSKRTRRPAKKPGKQEAGADPAHEPVSEAHSEIDELEGAIDVRVHEASRRVLSEDEVDRLADLEERLEDLTIAACEAARAPRVGDDPDWENRLVDEYADADTDLELDDYLASRRQDFDCERCPHAAFYSLYPQDPCEISVGPLLAVLDDALAHDVAQPMGPDDMRAMAERLESALETGRFKTIAEADAADLLHKSIDYLRFWAKLGFGVRPELVDEHEPVQTPDGPIGAPGAGQSTLLH